MQMIYQKMLSTLVGQIRNCSDGNHVNHPKILDTVEMGNVSFQHK